MINNPTGAEATREIFFPCTVAVNGVMTIDGTWAGAECNGGNEQGVVNFYAPHDFNTIVDLVMVLIARATVGAGDINLYARFASNGQQNDAHTAQDIATTYNLVNGQVSEFDVSTLFAGLVAGDYGSLDIVEGTAGHNFHVLGIRLKYV